MTEQSSLSNFHNRLIIQSNYSELLEKTDYKYIEFSSNLQLVKFIAMRITQNIPDFIPEQDILKQQVAELLYNAIIHGNNNESQKKIQVWFNYTLNTFSLIIKDEGVGFHDIDLWNDWCKKRRNYLKTNKLFLHPQYIAYDKNRLYHSHSQAYHSDGTALFAAVEYWNAGVVFTEKGNTIAVRKTFLIEKENEIG